MSEVSLRDFLSAPAAEKPWPPEVTHLSQSSVGMLFRCARQFERRYLHHEKERPGESIVVGSYFHETLNHNYASKVTTHEDLPLSDLIQYLGDVAVPKVLEEEGGVDVVRWDTNPNVAHSDAERIVSAYGQAVMPRIQPIGTEFKFELDVEGVPVPIIGYVDVWERERTLDTKTGKSVSTKPKPAWMLQGRLYAWATGRPTEYHSINRAAQPRIVTALESEQMIIPVPTEIQSEHMTRLFQMAAATISFYYSQFGNENWPATGVVPDWTRNMLPCDYCGWKPGCPAWS